MGSEIERVKLRGLGKWEKGEAWGGRKINTVECHLTMTAREIGHKLTKIGVRGATNISRFASHYCMCVELGCVKALEITSRD
jgi:hypothetical protein